MIIFSDFRDPIFKSRDPKRVLKTPYKTWCNHNNVMQLLLRVCSADRVKTIQCSMQLTAARFRHQLHLSYIATPQKGVHRRFGRAPDIARCNSRRKTCFAEYFQQSRSFYYSHWIFLCLIFKSWLFNPALIYDGLVISETRTNSKSKTIRHIDNGQYNSHTAPCSLR